MYKNHLIALIFLFTGAYFVGAEPSSSQALQDQINKQNEINQGISQKYRDTARKFNTAGALSLATGTALVVTNCGLFSKGGEPTPASNTSDKGGVTKVQMPYDSSDQIEIRILRKNIKEGIDFSSIKIPAGASPTP